MDTNIHPLVHCCVEKRTCLESNGCRCCSACIVRDRRCISTERCFRETLQQGIKKADPIPWPSLAESICVLRGVSISDSFCTTLRGSSIGSLSASSTGLLCCLACSFTDFSRSHRDGSSPMLIKGKAKEPKSNPSCLSDRPLTRYPACRSFSIVGVSALDCRPVI